MELSPLSLYGLVLLAAVAHAAWNALVKNSGDRLLMMAAIRLVGLSLGLALRPFFPWRARQRRCTWLSGLAGDPDRPRPTRFCHHAAKVRDRPVCPDEWLHRAARRRLVGGRLSGLSRRRQGVAAGAGRRAARKQPDL